ncbi:cyclase family protein [Candidatus Berkiella aquae]|uniref:cyclase family protein n=1 Tax=Candidatus Berkiella aquae TaxID=295108 RepID=UPI00217DA3DF|nr:cyclase family protein [Candidatus Berkiella aquae]
MSIALKQIPFKLIDLTHSLSPEIPSWDGGCGFEHQLHHDYEPESLYQFRTHKIQMNEGMGTHIDAPAHCIVGGRTISDLEVNELIAPCAVIDVSKEAHETYIVSLADVKAFEDKYGLIEDGSFVIFYTGWDRYWQQPEKYRNSLLFPSISFEAAQFLLNERKIAGLGIDTLSPDNPKNGYPVHKAVLGANKYIVENVANAASLPPKGSYSLCLPMKIKDGTEAPMRLIGIV